MTVKEIKEKVLPPSSTTSLRAPRASSRRSPSCAPTSRRACASRSTEEIEAQFRADVADALVAASKVDAAGPLVEARTRELLRGLARQVEARGIPLETYPRDDRASSRRSSSRGSSEEAQRSVARELVLEAVADKLGIDVPDAEVEALVREQAEARRRRRRRDARCGCARAAASRRSATTCACATRSTASPPRSSAIPHELAEAREAIWTPDKEKPPTETKLWTPTAAAN